MRPIIVGIGGAYSGAGKTTIASFILKKFKNWGAIKYTKTSLYCSVIDDLEVLSQEGKDTRRLLDSGAERVLWVRSPFPELGEILSLSVEMLSDLKVILIEGNSAVEVLKPDIVIFIAGAEKERFKKGAEKILKMADIVIFEQEPPAKTPESAERFSKNDVKEYINFIARLIKKYEDKK
jgi:molybdopterin-guanine dinucleotide biosynthesis protein